jgi:hypothetical protein
VGLTPIGDPQVIGVACALASPTAEQQAMYPDAVAYHQAHPCRCGNQAHLDGFYPCDVEGNQHDEPNDSNLVFCGSCGVLISIETGEYVGRRKPGAWNLGT